MKRAAFLYTLSICVSLLEPQYRKTTRKSIDWNHYYRCCCAIQYSQLIGPPYEAEICAATWKSLAPGSANGILKIVRKTWAYYIYI